MYLYCTTTDDYAETTSQVDIGFHYVALNPTGVPTGEDIVPDLLYYTMTDYIPISFPDGGIFTDTVTDNSTDGGANGSVSPNTANASVSWRPNQTGFYTGAVHFNGVSTTLDTGNSTRFNFTTDVFTINMWVQPYALPTSPNNFVLVGNGTYGASGWYAFIGPSGNVGLQPNSSSDPSYVATDNPVTGANIWTMLTFVRTTSDETTSNLLIYANGQLKGLGSNKIYTNPTSCSDSCWIGNYHAAPQVLDGDIGVVRIYSSALTSNQIYQLYTNGLTGLVR